MKLCETCKWRKTCTTVKDFQALIWHKQKAEGLRITYTMNEYCESYQYLV